MPTLSRITLSDSHLLFRPHGLKQSRPSSSISSTHPPLTSSDKMRGYHCQCRALGQWRHCKAQETCVGAHVCLNRCHHCRVANCGPVLLENKYAIPSVPSSSFEPTPGTEEEDYPTDILPPGMSIHRAWGKQDNFVPGTRPLRRAKDTGCGFPQYNWHDEKQ
ncbi:hypothetical protein QC762_512557 [Podospora pseudocomata]|uniref:Uncharacterized protein n=1 Tax=Podospora pseudocomata TaxID=2093779 RepID=A0ABR0GAM7_9PEZI|nr:hypothetical protein QC762_512557 [Podospora pseudocomata]